jgi:hypothetical protein
MTLSMKSRTQDLSTHRWKERPILIFAKSDFDAKLTNQLEEFRLDMAGLKDRKIIVYQIFEEYYETGFIIGETQKVKSSLLNKYKSSSAQFEFMLIGLDGGIKYKSEKLVKNSTLFSIIDGMPMRKAELNKNN